MMATTIPGIPPIRAEILSIGSELTSGQCLDTNSQWLSQRLAALGVVVGWHTTVADDLEANIEALRIATRRARLVLATGGLGPTQDDLTREAMAGLAGVDLIEDPVSLSQIQEMFARRGRTFPERNRVQALFPQGSEPIPNPHGTAPGVWMTVGNSVIAAMPGVPSEMFAMFENSIRPRLPSLGLGGGVLVQRKINCFGAGESAVEAKLLDLTRRDHVPEVGITVSDATISLRILARAETPEAAQSLIAPVEQTIRDRLGPLVFGVEDEELQDVVLRLLGEQRLTVATAEGVTAGLVAQRLASRPGASLCLRGGLVAYDNRVKEEWLSIPSSLIAAHGAISAPVAEAMAVAARLRFGSDLAVSTVGLAGPEGAMADKPVGLVFVAVADGQGVASQSWNWGGTRSEVQSRTAKLALDRLRHRLLKTPAPT